MASDNPERLFLQQLLNNIAITRAQEAIAQLGQALPCRVVKVAGSIVTVAFEVSFPQSLPNVTIPKAESQWFRAPTQVGDTGLTVPANALLGAISGLGGGMATNVAPGNLGALVWVPVAATAFSAVNVNAAYIAGPDGAVIQTENGSTVITANASGVTIVVGSKTWTFNSSGFTMSTGIVAETHIHSQGSDSAGDTEQNTSGPMA